MVLWMGENHGCRRFGLLGEEAEEILESMQTVEERMTKANSLKQSENVLTAIFLEGGIVFHSIFVGMNYGVTDAGTQGVPVMVALIFHQANIHFAVLS